MKRYRVKSHIRCILVVLALFFGLGPDCQADTYDVSLSWYIDLQQFNASAHNDLFCVDCHQSVADRQQHPDPADVTRDVSDFFDQVSCGTGECHEDVLLDTENGIHGRIRFENREKYTVCIDCHDPHRVQLSEGKTSRSSRKPVHIQCNPEQPGGQPAECQTDDDCLACHSLPANKAEAAIKESSLCFHCHSQSGEVATSGSLTTIPLIDEAAYGSTDHAGNRCSDCHTQSITYGHDKTTQSCASCHTPHDEKQIHDPHVGVDCRACHLKGGVLVDDEAGRITWEPGLLEDRLVTVHQFLNGDNQENCVRCHFDGNEFGAASMVLPAKGVLCIACHTATLSVSDTTTAATLIVSIFVFLGLLSLWLSAGSWPSEPAKVSVKAGAVLKITATTLFSRNVFSILKALLLDAVIQRKLFVQSPFRWFSHGLIFYSFLLRFIWGLVSLILSLAVPEWPLTMALLDKNQPWVAFIFDLTGALIILGVLLMMARRLAERRQRWPGLPRQEWYSMALIGGIIIVGFFLEGMRISMTLDDPGKYHAFLGYAISLLFTGTKGLTDLYGYVWYLHAALTAAFIIWLPFSRMFHIVMGPVAVAVNAALKPDHD